MEVTGSDIVGREEERGRNECGWLLKALIKLTKDPEVNESSSVYNGNNEVCKGTCLLYNTDLLFGSTFMTDTYDRCPYLVCSGQTGWEDHSCQYHNPESYECFIARLILGRPRA